VHTSLYEADISRLFVCKTSSKPHSTVQCRFNHHLLKSYEMYARPNNFDAFSHSVISKELDYLSDYQLSLWFIAQPCQYLRLHSFDRRRIGECGIGKYLERRPSVLRYYSDICLKGKRESMRNLNEGSRYASRISNQIPPDYSCRALPLQPLVRYKTLKMITLRGGSFRTCIRTRGGGGGCWYAHALKY
jgi:hypothetical protein